MVASTFLAAISTHAQVTQINSNKSLNFTFPLSNSKSIFVSAVDQRLWVSDGTLAGTVQLSSDIAYSGDLGATILISGKYIFAGSTTATGTELYITDGTLAGTTLLKDIVPGTVGSLPDGDGASLNGYIYFTAETPAEGRELWRTNGTPAGTTFVKDIVPGAAGSNYKDGYHLFSSGTYLLLMARTPSSGVELWRSDGTEAGTVFLKDINANGSDSSGANLFYLLNNLVLFVANDGIHGYEIWKTDGSGVGTTLLKDINPGAGTSTSYELFPGISAPIFLGFHDFNGFTYFQASDGTSKGELWRTDGTNANTTLVKDIISGVSPSFVFVINAVNLPGKFIFPVSNGVNRSELWESDGTPGGTVLFKSFSPSNAGTTPIIFVPFIANVSTGVITQQLFKGNKFFFAAGTATEGTELWISDGTLVNTSIVKDINAGEPDGIDGANLTYLYTSTHLYFAGNTVPGGNELWRTDGTSVGTAMVADIITGSGSSDPLLAFSLINGKIVFEATNGDDPVLTDLYAVDGNFTPLPIRLANFTVIPKSADAILVWYTMEELNSRDFVIQRSFDGVQFENIGIVAALGNSALRHGYSFTDIGINNSQRQVVYYRLLSSDIDGKTSYSPIVSVKLKDRQWSIRLAGNPVSGTLNVMVKGVSGSAQFMINDLSGKTLYSRRIQSVNSSVNIPVNNLESGIYMLVVTISDESRSILFFK